MKLNYLRPLLWTQQLDESIAFYVNVLGFTCVEKNDAWGWASLNCDDVWIMLSKPNTDAPFEKATFTGSFYLTVDDVDAWWEKLKDKAAICYEPEAFEWGMKEFAIYDNNGYIIQLGQELN